ncbi:MAG: riboflavin biosynthesis protein RibF [Cytophagaceae bacterium]|jgi:riboflavin kinase/FMN adenylyltransferase|nr:riboflavin biosynthesis protein RibF [Cytophagaceae bacterium]
MKIHSSIETFTGKKPVVATGIFDGVHPGHVALLRRVVELASEAGSESVVLTYMPHPRLVLNQDPDKLRLLTSLNEKVKMIAAIGVNHLIVLPFTLELASLNAETFIKEMLINRLDIGTLLVGYNHRFGKGGVTIEELMLLSNKLGFAFDQFRRIDMGNQHPSSTKIRNMLTEGNIKGANALLGYPYLLTGRVVNGSQRGRTLGYPTANVVPADLLKLVPPNGVYACMVNVSGKNYGGMLNIGICPTFNSCENSRSIEVHIFDFNKNIYSEEIEISFIDRIRNEMKFSTTEALCNQMKNDEKAVRSILETMIE